MTENERLAVLETTVNHLNWMLGLSAAALLAVFGVSSFILIPNGAKREVENQLHGAVEAALEEALGSDLKSKLESTVAEAETARDQARGAADDASRIIGKLSKERDEMERLTGEYAALPKDVAFISGTLWSWIRVGNEAFAKAAAGDVSSVERMRSMLDLMQKQVGTRFSYDESRIPLGTNVGAD